MQVYRQVRRRLQPSRLLAQIDADARRLLRGDAAAHDELIALLLAFGDCETAIADALAPEADDDNALLRALRRAALHLGRAVHHSWRREAGAARTALAVFAAALAGIAPATLPAHADAGWCEGYAQYGLYPETYQRAAEQLRAAAGAAPVVVVGLRSIGTSLSAVVGGTLAALGSAVRAYTVRPRGHPFDRRLVLRPALEAAWRAEPGACFAVVDEGPGISGSSFASVAETLLGLGSRAERIVLLPSWNPEPDALRSVRARLTWRRHRIYLASFESVWVDSGRLAAALPQGALLDLSAGAWRRLSGLPGAALPAVHPQHERRKYLLIAAGTSPGAAPERLLLRFAGLGPQARSRLARARVLASLDLTPPPLGVVHGMLVSRFVPGTPVLPETIDRPLLTAAAHYLATLRALFPAPATVDRAMLLAMVRANLAATLGEAWSDAADALAEPAFDAAGHAVALDGRMLAHEWLHVAGGYRKTDAVDHHDDHFFPGTQDIAWDVAAATVELARRPGEAAELLRRYRALSGDGGIAARLPFHRVAYLAFRLAYVTAAAAALGGTADGDRFAAEGRRYTALLRRELLPRLPRRQWA